MNDYEIVIGLETHVQLKTETKAFCGCGTEFGQKPNSSTCPVCLGLPGSLPVLNEKAFRYSIKTALALNCKIREAIKFDRKNYYYPDLPKNYQISQYDRPLGYDGFTEITDEKENRKRIAIKRVHLEEDAGKLIHDQDKGLSYVDFNRSGMPLLEIVSEPEISSAEDARMFLLSLKSILLYLEVSDCNMEEGSLRCDANISVRKKGEKKLGVKVEVKNMNSFKAVKEALEYEARRQVSLLEEKEKITQETRLWDEKKLRTNPMRSKEETHDYRYFPEPDLVVFSVDKEEIEKIKAGLPEFPDEKIGRFAKEYGLSRYDSSVLAQDKKIAEFFEDTLRFCKKPKQVANWLTGDIMSELNKRGLSIDKLGIKPEYLAEMQALIDDGTISGKIAKGLLVQMIETGKSPKDVVSSSGLTQVSDRLEIEPVIDGVIIEFKKSVDDFKSGKESALTFLVGQVMKKTKGRANPRLVNEILKEKLNK